MREKFECKRGYLMKGPFPGEGAFTKVRRDAKVVCLI